MGEVSNDADEGFEGLGGLMDDPDFPIPPTLTEASTPPAPAAAQEVPANVPAPATPVAQAAPAPSVATEQPGVGTPQQPTATEPTGPVTVDAILSGLQDDYATHFANVEKTFELTPDQLRAFEAAPMEMLPKLQAQTHLRSVTATLKYMKMLVPTMIQEHFEQQERLKEAETEFFGMWPKLSKKDHADDIRRMTNAFAQANPHASRTDLFRLIGAAVMAQRGLVASPAPAPAPAPVTPAAFRPASQAAPVVAQTQTNPDDNPFMGLGRDFET